MSTQQTNATDSSTPSLAASIPPELFENILAYVRNEAQLFSDDIFDTTSPHNASALAARRDGMRYLSACALTCVYWAQLTRQHIFFLLILRSSKDMYGLLSLFRAPQSPRITPICDILQDLYVYYTLGDHPWFHNLAGLRSRHRISHLEDVILYITGPATPAFVAASTRGSVLHPLFFAAPRVLSVVLSKGYNLAFYIQNIHLPNPTVFFNLLQDCLSLRPLFINCTNLTWDVQVDPVLQATPSSIGLKYTCHHDRDDHYSNNVSGCTDDVLVAAMLQSVSHHEFSRRHQGPHLNSLETSYLFDAMRTTWCGLSPELQQAEEIFEITSDSDPKSIQSNIAVRLSAGVFGILASILLIMLTCAL